MSYRERSFKATRKRSKYANAPTDGIGGHYHSKLEAKYGRDLEIRKRAGEISGWDRQVCINLSAHGRHICKYFIDFVVWYPNGEKEYVEVKGFETETWRLKWKIFEAQMAVTEPDARLTIVR